MKKFILFALTSGVGFMRIPGIWCFMFSLKQARVSAAEWVLWYLCVQMENVTCSTCGNGENRENMLVCDGCDDVCHVYCLILPLTDNQRNEWRCPKCIAKVTTFDLGSGLLRRPWSDWFIVWPSNICVMFDVFTVGMSKAGRGLRLWTGAKRIHAADVRTNGRQV